MLAKFSQVQELIQFLGKNQQFQTLFFDLDGTLVNSEPLHVQAVVHALCEFDQSVSLKELIDLQRTGIHHELVGVSDHEVFQIIEEKLKVKFHHSYDELVACKSDFLISDEVTALLRSPQCAYPEMGEALENFRNEGKTLYVVSASQRAFVHHVLKCLGWDQWMEGIFSREDSLMTKPYPEPYLKALEVSSQEKEKILILEDSVTGMAAAKASEISYAQAQWYS